MKQSEASKEATKSSQFLASSPNGADEFSANLTVPEKIVGLRCYLEGLAELQDEKRPHGDVRPGWLSFNRRDCWGQLVLRSDEAMPPLQKQLANIRQGRRIYVPPLIFEQLLQQSPSIRHNAFKTDVFCLGMSVLETFFDPDELQLLYDFQTCQFNRHGLQAALEMLIAGADERVSRALGMFLKNCILSSDEAEVFSPKEAVSVLKRVAEFRPIWDLLFPSDEELSSQAPGSERPNTSGSNRPLEPPQLNRNFDSFAQGPTLKDSQMLANSKFFASSISFAEGNGEEDPQTFRPVDVSMNKSTEIREYLRSIGVTHEPDFKDEEKLEYLLRKTDEAVTESHGPFASKRKLIQDAIPLNDSWKDSAAYNFITNSSPSDLQELDDDFSEMEERKFVTSRQHMVEINVNSTLNLSNERDSNASPTKIGSQLPPVLVGSPQGSVKLREIIDSSKFSIQSAPKPKESEKKVEDSGTRTPKNEISGQINVLFQKKDTASEREENTSDKGINSPKPSMDSELLSEKRLQAVELGEKEWVSSRRLLPAEQKARSSVKVEEKRFSGNLLSMDIPSHLDPSKPRTIYQTVLLQSVSDEFRNRTSLARQSQNDKASLQSKDERNLTPSRFSREHQPGFEVQKPKEPEEKKKTSRPSVIFENFNFSKDEKSSVSSLKQTKASNPPPPLPPTVSSQPTNPPIQTPIHRFEPANQIPTLGQLRSTTPSRVLYTTQVASTPQVVDKSPIITISQNHEKSSIISLPKNIDKSPTVSFPQTVDKSPSISTPQYKTSLPQATSYVRNVSPIRPTAQMVQSSPRPLYMPGLSSSSTTKTHSPSPGFYSQTSVIKTVNGQVVQALATPQMTKTASAVLIHNYAGRAPGGRPL